MGLTQFLGKGKLKYTNSANQELVQTKVTGPSLHGNELSITVYLQAYSHSQYQVTYPVSIQS